MKQNEKIKEAVYESLGAASMCWSETPKGVFDSTLAREIGDKLWDRIQSVISEKQKEMDDNEKNIRKFYEPAFAEKNKELEELKNTLSWLIGCGYNFTQPPFPLQSETKTPSK